MMSLNSIYDTVIVRGSSGKENLDESKEMDWLVVVECKKNPSKIEQSTIENWLKVRMKTQRVKVVFSD
jgi:hypothetical protein